MPPSESAILTKYLLTPAPFTDIVTLKEFRALFPKSVQTSLQIKPLYRQLQAHRNAVVDQVASNIADEVKRSKLLRQEVVVARLEAEKPMTDSEIEIESALFGVDSGCLVARYTLSSIIDSINTAVEDLEHEIVQLESEESELKEITSAIIGSMSDLRYGKLENGNLEVEVSQAMDILLAACTGNT